MKQISSQKNRLLSKRHTIPLELAKHFLRNDRQYAPFTPLDDETIRKQCDSLNWAVLSGLHDLSESILVEFSDRIDWGLMSVTRELSEDLLIKFHDKVEWEWIEQAGYVREEFLIEMKLKGLAK